MEDGSASSQSLTPDPSPKGEGRWESHTIIKL